MDLSIIIPTIGDVDILNPTLDAVFEAIEGLNVEVILIDDSKGGTTQIVRPGLRVLKSGGQGASNARNMGWRVAKADLLLFLDDDILIQRHHILKTLALHKDVSKKAYNFYWVYPQFLMDRLPKSKFGRYILEEGLYSNQHRLEIDVKELPKESRQVGLTSQFFSIHKRWMQEVGGYDSIPFAGIEDLLLFKKLDALGVEVFLLKDQIVFQNESKRIHLRKLFNRYRTGALTRRIAVKMGHPDLGVKFTYPEKVKGQLGALLLSILFRLEQHLPYGFFYRKTVRYALFVATYLGFYRDTLPK